MAILKTDMNSGLPHQIVVGLGVYPTTSVILLGISPFKKLGLFGNIPLVSLWGLARARCLAAVASISFTHGPIRQAGGDDLRTQADFQFEASGSEGGAIFNPSGSK